MKRAVFYRLIGGYPHERNNIMNLLKGIIWKLGSDINTIFLIIFFVVIAGLPDRRLTDICDMEKRAYRSVS